MDYETLIVEHDKLRHNAERLVAEYFGVSGYKVANVHINGELLDILYYDIGQPNIITLPKAWLELSDAELKVANREYAMIMHEEYMKKQAHIMATQRAFKEASDRAKYEELKKRFE